MVHHSELIIHVSHAYHPILTESTLHTFNTLHQFSFKINVRSGFPKLSFCCNVSPTVCHTPFSVLCTALRILLDLAFSNTSNTAETSFRCSSTPGNSLKYVFDTYEMIIKEQSLISCNFQHPSLGFNISVLKSQTKIT